MSLFEKDIVLEDGRALIRNLKRNDLAELSKIAFDEAIWKYYPFIVSDKKDLEKWFSKMEDETNSKTRIPFLIVDKKLDRAAGSTSYMNISEDDKRLEIGTTWLGSDFRGSGLNAHCKLLLLDYAFNTAGYIRVEFKTDFLNSRSRAALKKIGATEEGVFRSHMQMPYGRRRDTVYFSILKDEWSAVRNNYFKDLI